MIDVVGAGLDPDDDPARQRGSSSRRQSRPTARSVPAPRRWPSAIRRSPAWLVRNRKFGIGPVHIGHLAVRRRRDPHDVARLSRVELQRRVGDDVLENLVCLEIQPAVEMPAPAHELRNPSPYCSPSRGLGRCTPCVRPARAAATPSRRTADRDRNCRSARSARCRRRAPPRDRQPRPGRPSSGSAASRMADCRARHRSRHPGPRARPPERRRANRKL